MQAVVWAGPGQAWVGTSWFTPLTVRLARWGWDLMIVEWGDRPAVRPRRRPVDIHVFSGGMEAVTSGTRDMAQRLRDVEAAVAAAAIGRTKVVGICLGSQMIARVVSGLAPVPVRGGGEAGTTVVRAVDGRATDLTVATAHVQEIPAEFLAQAPVRHLWANDVTEVQGFAVGGRVAGVQFHPELVGRQAGLAARAFQRVLPAPSVEAPGGAPAEPGGLAEVFAQVGIGPAASVALTADLDAA